MRVLHFRVISAIIFSAMAVGQTSSFAPDYGKAKQAAAKMFQLFDREPAIDNTDVTGPMPVSNCKELFLVLSYSRNVEQTQTTPAFFNT